MCPKYENQYVRSDVRDAEVNLYGAQMPVIVAAGGVTTRD